MNRLPEVKIARINYMPELSPQIEGRFVDTEWVFHDIVAGRWLFQLPDRSIEVRQGNLVLLPPGMLHIVRPLQPGRREHHVIQFVLPLPDRDLLQAPLAIAVDLKTRRTVRERFATLMEEHRARRPYHQLRTSALITELIALYLRHTGSALPMKVAPLPLSANIERAVRLVSVRLTDASLGVPDLASVAGLSLSHFRRVFRSFTGMSPRNYIAQQRLQYAQAALLQGERHCGLVAEKSGFSSIHAFSKAFRRLAGSSPKKWPATIEQ